MSKKDIPYRLVKKTNISFPTFLRFRRRIKEAHLLHLYDRYFHAVLSAFERLARRVRSHLCIFVGPAKIRTISIPIDKIVVEHLCSAGWNYEVRYIDKIVGRVMFQPRVNPASGLEDRRIPTEHLVVLSRGN